MSMTEPRIRAAQSRVRIELLEVRAFCQEADLFFKRRIKEFDKSVSEEPGPRSDENDMYLSDQRMELEGQVGLTGYFGITMVFSTLERFLHRLYEGTMNLAVEPQLEDVVLWSSRKWLKVGDFQGFLKKMGIDEKPFDWNGIKKLNHLRNAIVHQGGMVTDANVKFLSLLGYKESQRVEVSISALRKASCSLRRPQEILSMRTYPHSGRRNLSANRFGSSRIRVTR